MKKSVGACNTLKARRLSIRIGACSALKPTNIQNIVSHGAKIQKVMRPRAFDGFAGQPRQDHHIIERRSNVVPQRDEYVVVQGNAKQAIQKEATVLDRQ